MQDERQIFKNPNAIIACDITSSLYSPFFPWTVENRSVGAVAERYVQSSTPCLVSQLLYHIGARRLSKYIILGKTYLLNLWTQIV